MKLPGQTMLQSLPLNHDLSHIHYLPPIQYLPLFSAFLSAAIQLSLDPSLIHDSSTVFKTATLRLKKQECCSLLTTSSLRHASLIQDAKSRELRSAVFDIQLCDVMRMANGFEWLRATVRCPVHLSVTDAIQNGSPTTTRQIDPLEHIRS